MLRGVSEDLHNLGADWGYVDPKISMSNKNRGNLEINGVDIICFYLFIYLKLVGT